MSLWPCGLELEGHHVLKKVAVTGNLSPQVKRGNRVSGLRDLIEKRNRDVKNVQATTFKEI